MRVTALIGLSLALLLAACGTTEKTVVVNPPAGSTVVVPPDGHVQVVPNPNNN